MIRPHKKCCNPVIPNRQASGYIGRQNAVHRKFVQPFVKHNGFRVRWRGLAESCQMLNNDMGMPDNVPICVGSGGAGHVSMIRTRERTRLEVIDCDPHGERLVPRYRSKVRGENEFGRGHVVHAWNDAYRGGVTRPASNLRTIGQRLVHGHAEINPVVARSCARHLPRTRDIILPIALVTSGDHRWVQSKRGLRWVIWANRPFGENKHRMFVFSHTVDCGSGGTRVG